MRPVTLLHQFFLPWGPEAAGHGWKLLYLGAIGNPSLELPQEGSCLSHEHPNNMDLKELPS